jgi:hypothetical protein
MAIACGFLAHAQQVVVDHLADRLWLLKTSSADSEAALMSASTRGVTLRLRGRSREARSNHPSGTAGFDSPEPLGWCTAVRKVAAGNRVNRYAAQRSS